MGDDGHSDLAEALDQFDRVEANLTKLEEIWHEYRRLIPRDISFGLDSNRSNELLHAFTDVVANLPPIDGYRIDAGPWTLDAIARARTEAEEIETDEPLARVELERRISEPGKELDEYRFRLGRARSRLVRDQALDVVATIDAILRDAELVDAHRARWRHTDRWAELGSLVSQLDRLIGNAAPGNARWSDLHRHLRFAQGGDLRDIVEWDWPSVRSEVDAVLYDDLEPIPVKVDDLGQLVKATPKGPVTTSVNWSVLTDEGFERLIYELVRHADGYENANWLMHTNAPDRGRDIEVYRVVNDPLAGTIRSRVIIQCKHWSGRSIGPKELVQCAETVKLWEPPVIDVLIIATSGRFSSDAVAIIEKRQRERTLPLLEPWPDSHLETLLSRRPSIAASFNLR